jgi:folate-dependent phosphoribosylglycinamide formyltransferase PurN
VAIEAGDTAETLEARVKALEPEFFLKVLRELVSGIRLV